MRIEGFIGKYSSIAREFVTSRWPEEGSSPQATCKQKGGSNEPPFRFLSAEFRQRPDSQVQL
jgi:hypothetical protein